MKRAETPDRYLQKRPDGGYRYVRRLPTDILTILQERDPRPSAFVRRSLDTHSLEDARARRDAMEEADDTYWASVRSDGVEAKHDAWRATLAQAKALRLQYRPADELATEASLADLVKRIALASGRPADSILADAALGGAAIPQTSLDDAFAVFETVIRRAPLARKSPNQVRKWRELKQRGLANFKRVVGDIALEAITREHARKFHGHWLSRILPEDAGVTPVSASAGNKDIDTMRTLFGEYMAHMGREDIANPFRGLRFADRIKASGLPFTESFLRETVLKPGALDDLNLEARLAVLALINTGARPSEIVNLAPAAIVLDAKIPYLDICETSERELKAAGTARRIPLAGVSLEAMREARQGFPRYRDRDTLSATVNKYLRAKGLMESGRHTLYGLRHGFEARLKLADVDEELRRYLMGHAIDRPRYGYGEDLTWAAAAVQKVAL